MIPQLLFWICVGVIAYTYVGYPLLLVLLVLCKGRSAVPEMTDWPKISVLMAVHNEEQRIHEAIRNILQNGYPPDKLEVIVCSDASTDNTGKRVEEYDDGRVRLVASPKQIGVNEVVALGAQEATGEVFLLAHAKTSFEQGAIQKVAHHFADPKVGVATGRIVYRNPLGTAIGSGYRGYWLIESGVRRLESRLGLGVVVVGAFEMIRREAYLPVPSKYSNDMSAPLYTRSKGYLCRCELDAVQYTDQKKQSGQEFNRRLRMAVRGWSSIGHMLRIVPFWPNTVDWLALISHKYLRWSTWLFMACALAANALLLGGGLFYQVVFGLQLAFYGAALVGWILAALGRRLMILWAPFYFCLLQVAGMLGLLQAICGRRVDVWKPVNE